MRLLVDPDRLYTPVVGGKAGSRGPTLVGSVPGTVAATLTAMVRILGVALLLALGIGPSEATALEPSAVHSRQILRAWKRYKSARGTPLDRELALMRLRKTIWDDPPPPPSRFDRDEWGGWSDEDEDCQDTRTEVLVRDSVGRVRYASRNRCEVTRGSWVCPHTGYEIDDPGELDVDHVVPLEHAWRHGGFKWSDERKREFANDLENVVAVYARSNRSKGRLGITEWVPCLEEYHPEYVRRWLAIKRKYGLYVTTQEQKVALRLGERGSLGEPPDRPDWCEEEEAE